MAISIAEINTKNISHNIKMIREKNNHGYLLAMVKANAYGHNIKDLIQFFRKEKVEYLGVAFITEALKLRQYGDNGKILVMVSPEPSDADYFIDFNIETAFSSFDILKAFEKRAKERDVIIYGHLYIDTGMHRDGIPPEDVFAFMDYVRDKPNIKIVGLMTHLAASDAINLDFTYKQLATFETIKNEIELAGYKFKYIHTANSAAILNYPQSHYNMVRPGISLYGYMSNETMAKQLNLKPSLTWKSKVMHVLNVPEGDFVGYSQTFTANKDMTIAVVPGGYADGLPRNMSNKFQCLIHGKRFNSVGSICMDEFMVDVTESNIKQGDEVVLIGKQGNEEISVYELANLSNSIPWERIVAISDRIKRVIVY